MQSSLSRSDGLVRAAPSAVGISAASVEAFLDAVEAAGLEMHAMMLHRHDHLVVDASWWPYRTDQPRLMHSVAKSFTACAIGMALEEGRFRLGDKVISFFPDHLPAIVDDKLAAMTVEDLLTMRSGHAAETSGSLWRARKTSWIAEFFKIPVVHQPGTVHVYTSAASYMLSAILTRTTGQTLHDYLRPRLFEPLGIEGEHWDLGPDGFNPGGNGLTCRVVDILKLGILHARNGMWEGRRLLSEAWVAAATRPQGDPAYGYHWAVGADGSFSAVGVFVQMVTVFPLEGVTLAITGAMEDSAQIVPLIEAHLVPGFLAAPLDDDGADRRLEERLAAFRAARPLESRSPDTLPPSTLTFKAEPNCVGVAGFRLAFRDGGYLFTLDDAQGSHTLAGSVGRWIECDATLPGRDLHHGYDLASARIVAGAQWRDDVTFEMTWIYVETAFRDTVVCRFENDRAILERSVNVNSGARAWPAITGIRASGRPGEAVTGLGIGRR